MADAQALFEWRSDQTTRLASHDVSEFGFDSHLSWLEAALNDPRRTLLIAEEDGRPVGTVRIDLDPDGQAELSWTVAPAERGKGVAKRMLRTVADRVALTYTLRAEIKVGNQASIRIAESAGLRLSRREGEVLHYIRYMSESSRP